MSDRAAAILAALADQADFVIVTTGALHLSAGALVVGPGGRLPASVVAARDQARRDDVEYAVESLRLVGVERGGTVLAERRRSIAPRHDAGRLARNRPQPAPRPPVVARPRRDPRPPARIRP